MLKNMRLRKGDTLSVANRKEGKGMVEQEPKGENNEWNNNKRGFQRVDKR